MDFSAIKDLYIGSTPVQSAWLNGSKVWGRKPVVDEQSIRDAMVLWYDLKRQGATNENMAADPTLRDLSGNGHDATCYNFAWAKNSGIGMYGDRDFSDASASDKSVATVVKESNTKLRLTTTQLSSGISTYNLIAFYRFNNNTYTTEWRIKVTGLKENQGLRLFIHNNIGVPAYVLDNNSSVDEEGRILSDGTYLIKPVLNTNTPETATAEFYATSFPFRQETAYDVTIELLPQFPHALVSDGVDDYAMVKGLPMLNKEDGYTVIVKRTHIDNNLNQYTLIAKNSTNNNTDGAFKFEQLTGGYRCSTDSFGISTRLDFSRYPHNSSKLNELLQSEEWAYSEEDEPTESTDFIQVAAIRNLMNVTKTGIQEMSLTDEEALEVKDMYPEWGSEGAEMGKQVEAGFKLRNTGVLYKVLQLHTLQEQWEPGAQGTEALYAVVSANADEEHAGTLEDPIPYVQNMPIEEGKYYTQYGVTYIGILTTLTGYPQDLKDMPSVAMPVE